MPRLAALPEGIARRHQGREALGQKLVERKYDKGQIVFNKGDSGDWILDFNAAEGDKLKFLGFGFANFGAVPLVDLSTPGHPAVQMTITIAGATDQLTIFGATLAQLNATNVLVA
mgnify:CR=1 FL=1